MDCSLREFLLTGRLGELAFGVNRTVVFHAMGTPMYWEGKSKLPMLGSAIWVYNSLQLVFTKDDRVEIIRLNFDVTHESQFVCQADMVTPLVFTDISPCEIADHGSFVKAIRGAKIPFQDFLDRVGKPIIQTTACVCKFSKILRYQASVQSERAVRSSAFYVVSISTKT